MFNVAWAWFEPSSLYANILWYLKEHILHLAGVKRYSQQYRWYALGSTLIYDQLAELFGELIASKAFMHLH